MSAVVETMHPFARRLARDRNASKPRACRNLFGRPNKEEIDHILQTELQNTKNEDMRRYNFDFDSDTPLPGGKYEWEFCEAKNVPALYRTVAAAGVAESTSLSLPQRTRCFIASEPPVFRPVQSAQNTETQTLSMGLQARLTGPIIPEDKNQTNSTEIVSRTDVEVLKPKCTLPIKHNPHATIKPTQCRRQNVAGTSKTKSSANSKDQPKITAFLKQKKSSAKRKAEDEAVVVKRRNISPESTSRSEEVL